MIHDSFGKRSKIARSVGQVKLPGDPMKRIARSPRTVTANGRPIVISIAKPNFTIRSWNRVEAGGGAVTSPPKTRAVETRAD
jgi:hypothetical protein